MSLTADGRGFTRIRYLLPWIFQAPLDAEVVEGLHDGQGFVERHDGAFDKAFAEAAHEFLGLKLVTVASEREFQKFFAAGIEVMRHGGALPPAGVHLDATQRAENRGFLRGVETDGRIEHGQFTFGMPKNDRALFVHASGTEVGKAAELRGRAKNHGSERDGIDADVEQRAAAERRVEPTSLSLRGTKAEIRREHPWFADGTGGEQFAQAHERGKKPRPHGFHDEEFLFTRGPNDRGCFARVEGERFFAEDGFAGGKALKCVFSMKRVRGCDVERVHGGIFGERGVTRVATGDIEASCEGIRCGRRA